MHILDFGFVLVPIILYLKAFMIKSWKHREWGWNRMLLNFKKTIFEIEFFIKEISKNFMPDV